MDQSIILNTGHQMPQIGIGLWQVGQRDISTVVNDALAIGYRSFDTAASYGNERELGSVILSTGIPRGELFITTKLWNSEHGYDKTMRAFESSRLALQIDYVDMYMIHWPVPSKGLYSDSWRALQKLQSEGQIRSIGVSNFNANHLRRIAEENGLAPSINQIELHPQFQNRFAAQASFRMGVPVEAWAPLGQGSILREPLLNEVAGRLEVSPAQVVVAWHLLNGRVVIPKSRRREKMKENFDAQSLKLSVEDKTLIDSLDQGERGRLGPDPDTFYLPEPGLHLVEGVGERNTK